MPAGSPRAGRWSSARWPSGRPGRTSSRRRSRRSTTRRPRRPTPTGRRSRRCTRRSSGWRRRRSSSSTGPSPWRWPTARRVGLAMMDGIAAGGELETYPYLHAARADLLRRLGRWSEAEAAYRRALELTANGAGAGVPRGPPREVNGGAWSTEAQAKFGRSGGPPSVAGHDPRPPPGPTLGPMHAPPKMPGLEWVRDLSTRVPAARHLRRGRPDRHPRPGRDGLCGGGGAAADRRPLRDDRAAARLRAARAVADPGPRPGLVAPPAHRGGDPAAGRRRRGTRGRPGGAPRGHRRRGHRGRRRGAARLPDRPAVGAGPPRLSQRHRPDRHRQPAAQAVRVHDRGRLAARRVRSRSLDGLRDGATSPGRARDRARVPGRHPRLPPVATEIPGILVAVVGSTLVSARLPARRAGRDRGRRPAPGRASAGDPAAAGRRRHPRARARGARASRWSSATDTSVLSRTFSIRRGEEVGPGPRARRAGRGEPGDRPPVGDAGQQQRVADPRRRGRRGADAAHRRSSGRSRSGSCSSRRRASSPTCRPRPWPRSSSPPPCRSSTSARWSACGGSGRPSSGWPSRASSASRSSA